MTALILHAFSNMGPMIHRPIVTRRASFRASFRGPDGVLGRGLGSWALGLLLLPVGLVLGPAAVALADDDEDVRVRMTWEGEADETVRVDWIYEGSTLPVVEGADVRPDVAPFEVPYIGEVEIDASVADWWDRGLPLKFLADGAHRVPDPDNLSAEVRLGWNEDGLLVLVKVIDDVAAEHPDEKQLWEADSIELFVSEGVGSSNRYQLAIAPGRDAGHPEPRHWFYNKSGGRGREDLTLEYHARPLIEGAAAPGEAEAETEAQAEAGAAQEGEEAQEAEAVEGHDIGYVVEMLLPWSNLDAAYRPLEGDEFGFQIYVNDLDDRTEINGRESWHWIGLHPSRGASGNRNAMMPFRLAERAGPGVRSRGRINYDSDSHELHVELYGDEGLVDRAVELYAGDHHLADASFERDGHMARATIEVPRPPYGERWGAFQARIADERPLVIEPSHRASQGHASRHAGVFQRLENEQLRIDLDREDRTVTLAFSELTRADRHRVMAIHNARVRQSPPEWVEGYALRYVLNLTRNLLDHPTQTVTATLPNGGWLNEWGDDIAVFASDGTEVPVIVLSHAPDGDTTIQFRRHQYDDVYWVYAGNPDAGPRDFQQFDEDPEELRLAAEDATLKMMAAQQQAGELTGELRDLTARVERERETLRNAEGELAEWGELLPERVADKEAAAAALEQAEATHEAAVEAHKEPSRIAEERTNEARRLTRIARTARGEANDAEQVHTAAERELEQARAAAARAEREHAQATERHNAAAQAARAAAQEAAAARAEADRLAREQRQREQRGEQSQQDRQRAEREVQQAEARAERAERTAAEARAATTSAEAALEAAAEALAAAPERVAEAAAALSAAAATMQEKRAAAEAAEGEAEPAEEAAREARLAAAPTANALEEAEAELRTARSRANRTQRLVNEARDRIQRAERIKSGAEEALAELLPVHGPLKERTETAQQQAREYAALAEEKHQRYYDLAYEADPRLFREGLTVEYREWAGDKLGDWPVVIDGLHDSDTVTDNAIVASVYQPERLFRGTDPLNFAASYRGYLKTDESGVYSFFVNAEDTVFLFINGYLVYSRVGTNDRLRGRVPTFAIGADMQLEEGVHTFEVHHVVGNTRGAVGYAMLMWIPPEENSWAFIPESAFPRSTLAVPVSVEAADGEPVALLRHGTDDKLSADGVDLYLTRFEAIDAAGRIDPERLKWTFEDGTTATGRSVRHVFFESGDALVQLKSHPDLPPFRRRIHITPEPNPTGPHSLHRTVEAIGQMALSELTTSKLNDAYHFLRISGQDNRWPVMEQVTRELLAREGLDLKHKALLYGSLMRALAQQGRGADAVELIDEAIAAMQGVRTLRAQVMLEAANMYRDVMRDFSEADELYERIIVENNRLRHPIVRAAAVAWGDMYLDAGDRARAGEAYRMARRLGEIGAGATAGDPVQRGALLRVAEQQLQADDVRQSRRMLERIEQNYPEEKLDGLYRFLRAEVDRHAGEYEAAIRHYEVVMQLSEWASYHPHAMRGIADSYYRMGEFRNALDWYAALESRYPRPYHEHDMGQDVEVIRARLERLEAQAHAQAQANAGGDDVDTAETEVGGAGDAEASLAGRLFSSLSHNFEPGNPNGDGGGSRAGLSLTMGFDGPGTFMVRPGEGQVRLPDLALENLPSQGSLWVEFWYRTRLGDTTRGAHDRYTRVRVIDEEREIIGNEQFYFPRTFGEWRKVAFEFDAPRTQDGVVEIYLRTGGEILEIDAVEIKHVSDGQNNALRRFLDGADPQ